MSQKIRDSNYCDLAEYIENDYICRGSGEVCSCTMNPNQFECYEYSKFKRKIEETKTLC